MSLNFHLGVLVSHPIQYYAPWFRYLANRLNIEVFYCHRQDAKGQSSAGFGVEFDWDVPLLEGYPHRWLNNVAARPSLRSFAGCDTPEVHHILRSERFDAFLVFGWNRKSALQAIWACWRNHVPVLMRGDSQLPARRSPIKSAAKYFPYRWLLPRLDAHLHVGKRNKEYLQHYGVPENRLFFVPHFVDNEFFVVNSGQEAENLREEIRIRSELGIPSDAFVFLFVGKLISKKRPADFVHAYLKVLNSQGGNNIHALFVGDGPWRTCLETATRSSGRIHFAGFRNQSEIPIFYEASNVLVLPSDSRESWGLVVNEAAACGIPAVVSDAVGCAPDMIDEGLTGFTYPVGDVEALADRMLAMKSLCEKKPTAIRQALGKKMVNYSMKKATEGLERALEAVTKRMA